MTDNALAVALSEYFSRLLHSWEKKFGSLPKIPWQEGVDPKIYQGQPDENGWVTWSPLQKHEHTDLSKLEDIAECQLHSSFHTYLNSFWFCNVGGEYNSYHIDLEPVLPSIELEDWTSTLLQYKTSHSDRITHIPLGIESDGLLVVMNNESGAIALEHYEESSFLPLADSLVHLIQGLSV